MTQKTLQDIDKENSQKRFFYSVEIAVENKQPILTGNNFILILPKK